MEVHEFANPARPSAHWTWVFRRGSAWRGSGMASAVQNLRISAAKRSAWSCPCWLPFDVRCCS